MIISNLNYLEITEDASVKGGLAISNAISEAYAIGRFAVETDTFTYTSVSSGSLFSTGISFSGSSSIAL